MAIIDVAVLIVYLIVLICVGLWFARRAGADTDHYFLGGRRLPWWALATSGMSSNLDTAGTMTILTLIYLFGVHGFFVEMRGGVVLPIAVFLAFMGKWHRRSGVTTTAEWMILRFGPGWQGRLARYTAAATYLVITIGMVVFFISAASRFLAVFLPFSPVVCAVGIAFIALAYTLASGLYGVVWTDVFQAFLIGLAALYVAVCGALLVSPELLAEWPGASFNTVLPRVHDAGLAPYEWFIFFLVIWFAKGWTEGLGGSGGSAYMAQRFYAAADDVSCQRLAMLWTVLFAFRWPMVLGFALIAIHMGIGSVEPELILPEVLASDFFPAGVRGLIIVALFAASMSTFDSTINAGASYVVKDIVQPLAPRLSERGLVWCGYLASALIVACGLILALTTVDSIMRWWVIIVMQLFPAFLIPFALRWFWWRFNGLGFALGVASGFLGSLIVTVLGGALQWNEIHGFLFICGLSALGSISGAVFGPRTKEAVVEIFYRQVRPLGLWPRSWRMEDRVEHRGDWIRLILATVWQVCTFLLPMTLILREWVQFSIVAAVWTLCFIPLWREVRGGK